ncbi:hypothetical protein SAMN02982917_2012 [Azospirillum oryzae]|uniref:Peptidase S74 domain-containing protein n=1 Tax=Azospirillum oryzae TaxID=286727 RepID=A0A1X7ETS4_9PROT|nr:hypothetical protein [Azospirillum oryzae]SMF39796.1 hypothetical protein SAMN02982917_2012 [Azospirillum oryzae]
MLIAVILGGLALLGLMVSVSATVVVVMLGGMVSAQLDAENRQIMASAAQQLAAEATNLDGDAVPEVTLLRAAVAGEPALPAGGWYIAASSGAPKLDVWGAPLVVCAVDNGVRGTQPELAGLIPGTSVPTELNAAPLFALIMAGENGLLETSCAAALGGNASGDDSVRRVSVAESMQLAGPLVATAPETVEYGTDGLGSTFRVNGAVESQSLAVSGEAAVGKLTLGQPLAIGDGGTSASTAAGAWWSILQGAPADSLAWQVAGAVQVTGGTLNGVSIGATTAGFGNFSSLTVNGATVWTTANDGAGSGLDADMIDGVPVQANGATTGQVLQWNGSGYAPSTLVAGGGGGIGLVEADTLQTVTARGASTNQVISAAGYLYSSDPRLKADMRAIPADEALRLVERLEGLRYVRLSTAEGEIGFNAEAVEKVLPEVVRVGPDGLRSVAYGNLTAVLVQALHELRARQDAVTLRLACLAAAMGACLLGALGWGLRRRGWFGVMLAVGLAIPLVAGIMGWSAPAAAQSCPSVPGSMRCIPAGATLDVTAYGVCKRLTNTRSLAMMVPLGSAAEWTSAYSNSAAVATVAACYTYSWSGWSGWSGCSASCGGGTQSQTRTCLRSETGVAGSTAVDPSYCGGGSTTNTQSCNTQSCCTPNPRVTGYGGCSASCGGGSQTVYWEDGCGGSWTTSQSCNTQGCCAGNQGQQCNKGWCDSTGGNSCANWYATPTSCGQGDGTGSIAYCDEGTQRICCNDYIGRGRIQCDGSCQ